MSTEPVDTEHHSEIASAVEAMRITARKAFSQHQIEDSEQSRRMLRVIAALSATTENADFSFLSTSEKQKLVADCYAIEDKVGKILQSSPSDIEKITDEILHIYYDFLLLLPTFLSSRSELNVRRAEIELDSAYAQLQAANTELERHRNQSREVIEKQADRLELLSKRIAIAEEGVSKQIADWQSQFANAEATREKRHNELLSDISKQSRSNIDEMKNFWDNSLRSFSDNYSNKMELIKIEAEAAHGNILELHRIVAGDSVAGSFLEASNTDRIKADSLRRGSIWSLAIASVWLAILYGVNFTRSDALHLDIVKIFPGLAVSGVLLWIAAYLAKQSARHRQASEKSRWYALRIKALDPFISSMPTDQQLEIKRQMASLYFAADKQEAEEQGGTIDEHMLASIAKAFSTVVSSARK